MIAHKNLADDGTVTAGAEESSLPVTNLQNDPVAKVYRTTAGATSPVITIDMGSQVTIRVIALTGTNLTSTTNIHVWADNTDNTALEGDELNTGTVDARVSDEYQDLYYVLSSDITARYWRISLTSTGVSSFVEAGRLFMGPAWLPDPKAEYGWSPTFNDPSNHVPSLGQQNYVDARNKRRSLQFTLGFMSESDAYDQVFELDRLNGRQKNVLVMMDQDNTSDLRRSQWSVLGLVERSTGVTHRTLGIYRKRFTIRERL